MIGAFSNLILKERKLNNLAESIDNEIEDIIFIFIAHFMPTHDLIFQHQT